MELSRPDDLLDASAMSSNLRYEFKLASDNLSPAQARTWLRLHPEGFQVAYPAREINNLYLDTFDLKNFNDNLTGLSARQKLRLRWYGVLEGSLVVNPVLELKLKENMLGEKKRQQLAMVLDMTRPYAEILKGIRSHVDQQWRSRLLAFTRPALINRYRREYYVSPDGAVRATIDYDLVSYDQRIGSRPNLDRRLPLPSPVVIEVKSAPENYQRLQRVMGYFPILRTRSSKYVSGMMGGSF